MADAPADDMRDAILAELEATPAEDAPAPVAEEAPAEVEAEADAEADVEVEAPAEDEGEEVEASADEESADEDDDVFKSDDPKEQKLLDNVRRAEKRMREAAARRDAEFEQKQREWQAQIDRVAQLDRLASRAKYDPVSVLRALGISDDDLVTVAQAAYAESPEGQKDPARKAAAAAALKEREKIDALSATQKRIADLEAKLEQQTAAAQAQAEAARYIAEVNSAAASKYPLVAQMLKADPEETSDAIVATYDRLAKTLNRAPKPAEVVAAYDKRERARLEKLGIDPATVIKTPAKKPTVVVPAKKPANSNAKPATKVAAVADEREAILAELAALPT